MEDERIMAKFFASLRRKWLLILLAVLGIALVIWGSNLSSEGKYSQSQYTKNADTAEAYRKQLESEIASMCQEIRGVGKVKVMITLTDGEQYDYSGGKVVATKMPRVCGVAIICEGGENERIKAEITQMVSALLEVGTHRIYVGKSK